MPAASPEITAPLTTADGTPLKASFARALRRSRLRAVGLVLPLFLFLFITFLAPIGDMLFRSVENQLVGEVLHRTVKALSAWNERSGELPGEAAFAALVADFQEGRENRTIGRVGVRLNYEMGGMSSLFRKTARRARRLNEAPYQAAVLKIDKRWGDLDTWRLIKREGDAYTPSYYLAAVDMRQAADGSLAPQVGGAPDLSPPLRPDPVAELRHHRAVPRARLSDCVPDGDPARANRQSPDDHGAASVLDVPAGAHHLLDRTAPAAGHHQRPAGVGAPHRR